MIDHATARTVLDRLRSAPPLVGCITNSVVTNFTANVLLALGAAPAMVDIIGEAGPFAATADGQLINVGTPTPEPLDALADALAWSDRPVEVAEELWVDVQTLDVRVDGLNPAERAELDTRLTDDEEGTR